MVTEEKSTRDRIKEQLESLIKIKEAYDKINYASDIDKDIDYFNKRLSDYQQRKREKNIDSLLNDTE